MVSSRFVVVLSRWPRPAGARAGSCSAPRYPTSTIDRYAFLGLGTGAEVRVLGPEADGRGPADGLGAVLRYA
jgi:hypothetical protein